MSKRNLRDTLLTATQVRILKLLGDLGTMTRKEIDEAIQGDITTHLGPVYVNDVNDSDRTHGRKSLLSLGMVSVTRDQVDGKTTIIIYSLTSKGRDAASKYEVRDKVPREYRIPGVLLDPATVAVKKLRTYGLELFTDEDIRQVLERLPREYHDVPLDSVRQQIVNRRKQGAFTVVNDWPEWYVEYRESTEWDRVSTNALKINDHRCSLNHAHKDGLNVYHRDLIALEAGEEEMHRGWFVVLCESCYRRNRNALPQIPNERP
jgi:DNA-binding MarR family transcriptional regulator